MVQFKKLDDLNSRDKNFSNSRDKITESFYVQYCDCCEIVTQCNLNSHQREFYRFHDILQVPIAGNYFDNPIKKIKEDEIPIYEIKYVVLRQEFQGVPYLLLKQRDKI